MSRAAYFFFGALMACSVDHTGLNPIDASGPVSDVLSLDAPDGLDGGPDTGLVDTGVPDIGLPDSGPMIDTGPTDSGAVDSGDAGCPVRERCSDDGLSLETCSASSPLHPVRFAAKQPGVRTSTHPTVLGRSSIEAP